MSARPLRAPRAAVKYSRIFIPSRKLALIGISIVLPVAEAIRPRIPASWRICLIEPRAPETAIILMGLYLSRFFCRAVATSLVQASQMATTRCERSSSDSMPFLKKSVMTSTFFSASASSDFFSGGMVISYTEMVMAPLVEYLKPCSLSLSSTSQVTALPWYLMQRSTMSDSSSLVVTNSISLTKKFSFFERSTKPRSCGMGRLKIRRPSVVSMMPVRSIPSASFLDTRTRMRACSEICPFS